MKLQFFSIFFLPTSPMSPQMKAKAFASFVDDDVDDDEDVDEGIFTLDILEIAFFRERLHLLILKNLNFFIKAEGTFIKLIKP